MINNFLILAVFALNLGGFLWILKRLDDQKDRTDSTFNEIAEAFNQRAAKVNTLYDLLEANSRLMSMSEEKLERIEQNQLDEGEQTSTTLLQLSQRLNDTRVQLAELKARPVPEARDWHVIIGGESKRIKALTASQFVANLDRLPDFLFTFLSDPKASKNKSKDLDASVEYAKELLEQSLLQPTDLDRLTVPEAQEALRIIVKANGIDTTLASVFAKKAATPSSGLTTPPDVTASDLAN